MHLEQLEQRAALFPQWLAYDLDLRYPQREYFTPYKVSPKELMRTFRETGTLYVRDSNDNEPTISQLAYCFDDWLFQNQQYDLVDYANYPPEEGLIDYIKTKGRSISWPFVSSKLSFDDLYNKIAWLPTNENSYDGNKINRLPSALGDFWDFNTPSLDQLWDAVKPTLRKGKRWK